MDDATLLELEDGWFDDFQPASSKEQTCGKDPGFGQQGRGSAEENLHPNKWKQSSLGPAAQTKQAPILQGQSQCVSQECGTSSSSIDPLLKLLNSSQYRLGSGKHQGGYADSPNGKRLQTRTDFKGHSALDINATFLSCGVPSSSREIGHSDVVGLMKQGGRFHGRRNPVHCTEEDNLQRLDQMRPGIASIETGIPASTHSAGKVSRKIPGPAGLLMAAVARGHTVSSLSEIMSGTNKGSVLRIEDCPDIDFFSGAWQTALQALDLDDFDDCSPLLKDTVAKLSQERDCRKVPRILLLVMSVQMTAAGDAFAKLKDPTGCIGAGVHSGVLASEANFGPGAVLMLNQVTLLCMPLKRNYLVVTPRNIIQVFPAGTRAPAPLQRKTSWSLPGRDTYGQNAAPARQQCGTVVHQGSAPMEVCLDDVPRSLQSHAQQSQPHDESGSPGNSLIPISNLVTGISSPFQMEADGGPICRTGTLPVCRNAVQVPTAGEANTSDYSKVPQLPRARPLLSFMSQLPDEPQCSPSLATDLPSSEQMTGKAAVNSSLGDTARRGFNQNDNPGAEIQAVPPEPPKQTPLSFTWPPHVANAGLSPSYCADLPPTKRRAIAYSCEDRSHEDQNPGLPPRFTAGGCSGPKSAGTQSVQQALYPYGSSQHSAHGRLPGGVPTAGKYAGQTVTCDDQTMQNADQLMTDANDSMEHGDNTAGIQGAALKTAALSQSGSQRRRGGWLPPYRGIAPPGGLCTSSMSQHPVQDCTEIQYAGYADPQRDGSHQRAGEDPTMPTHYPLGFQREGNAMAASTAGTRRDKKDVPGCAPSQPGGRVNWNRAGENTLTDGNHARGRALMGCIQRPMYGNGYRAAENAVAGWEQGRGRALVGPSPTPPLFLYGARNAAGDATKRWRGGDSQGLRNKWPTPPPAMDDPNLLSTGLWTP